MGIYVKSNHRHRGSGDGAQVDISSIDFGTTQLVNEFKGFPAYVAPDADLVTLNLWWDDTSSPTTKCTFVDLAGEAGITETYEYALKCVGDSSGDGFNQRWTYADEPRVKSGQKFSALFAVWAPAGRIVTCALTTSIPTTVSAVTTTTAAWQIIAVENLTLDGTYVEAICTIDGAGTYYVVPLGACIGTKALALPPRKLRLIDKKVSNIYNADPGGAAFFDVDYTNDTSPLTAALNIPAVHLNSSAIGGSVFVRRNGDTVAAGGGNRAASAVVLAVIDAGQVTCLCDDGQIVELHSSSAAANTETVQLGLSGFWEWE